MNKKRIGNLAEIFPKKTPGLCRRCEKKLSGGRRSWCSDACRDHAYIVCFPNTARDHVYLRDKGVCAECGVNTKELRLRMRIVSFKHRKIFKKICEENGWPKDISRSWWEADHIIPVSEGGGLCGLDNYRTLCIPCHRKDTAAVKSRLAQKRKLRNETRPVFSNTLDQNDSDLSSKESIESSIEGSEQESSFFRARQFKFSVDIPTYFEEDQTPLFPHDFN